MGPACLLGGNPASAGRSWLAGSLGGRCRTWLMQAWRERLQACHDRLPGCFDPASAAPSYLRLPSPPPIHPPQDDPSLVEAAVADLQAVVERDPACDTYVKPLLFFKGFQASSSRGWWRLCGVAQAWRQLAGQACRERAALWRQGFCHVAYWAHPRKPPSCWLLLNLLQCTATPAQWPAMISKHQA